MSLDDNIKSIPSCLTETNCRFVSSRGLLKSCKLHVAKPASSMKKLPWEFIRRIFFRADTIYLTPDLLNQFATYHMWRLRKPFTLVTGDSDLSVSAETLPKEILNSILENPRLVAWFAQNLEIDHPKIHSMPLGLDYHTLSTETATEGNHDWGHRLSALEQEQQLAATGFDAGSFAEKTPRAFCNWHFAADRGNRQDCLRQAHADAVVYQEKFLPRHLSWQENAKFAFTLSPFGVGLDCHRTWEAMVLGTVPIVFSSPIDPLFEHLPVVIVHDWREVTSQRLVEEQRRIAEQKFDFSRMELNCWVARLYGEEPAPQEPMSIEEFRQSLRLATTSFPLRSTV